MNNFNSKKFVSFMYSQTILAAILIVSLITQTFSLSMTLFMTVGIIGLVVLPAAYIFNQKKLDTVKEVLLSVTNKITEK